MLLCHPVGLQIDGLGMPVPPKTARMQARRGEKNPTRGNIGIWDEPPLDELESNHVASQYLFGRGHSQCMPICLRLGIVSHRSGLRGVADAVHGQSLVGCKGVFFDP